MKHVETPHCDVSTPQNKKTRSLRDRVFGLVCSIKIMNYFNVTIVKSKLIPSLVPWLFSRSGVPDVIAFT